MTSDLRKPAAVFAVAAAAFSTLAFAQGQAPRKPAADSGSREIVNRRSHADESGDKARAIENYEKSLALDPKNQSAASQLKKLNKEVGRLSTPSPYPSVRNALKTKACVNPEK